MHPGQAKDRRHGNSRHAVGQAAVHAPASPIDGQAHLIEDLWRLAGGSALDGPLGLLAVEGERLAADRHLTTARRVLTSTSDRRWAATSSKAAGDIA
jgi:hypothetical protein